MKLHPENVRMVVYTLVLGPVMPISTPESYCDDPGSLPGMMNWRMKYMVSGRKVTEGAIEKGGR
jgi:hypothetical protein